MSGNIKILIFFLFIFILKFNCLKNHQIQGALSAPLASSSSKAPLASSSSEAPLALSSSEVPLTSSSSKAPLVSSSSEVPLASPQGKVPSELQNENSNSKILKGKGKEIVPNLKTGKCYISGTVASPPVSSSRKNKKAQQTRKKARLEKEYINIKDDTEDDTSCKYYLLFFMIYFLTKFY